MERWKGGYGKVGSYDDAIITVFPFIGMNLEQMQPEARVHLVVPGFQALPMGGPSPREVLSGIMQVLA